MIVKVAVPDIDSDHPDAPPMYVIIAKYLACKVADGDYKYYICFFAVSNRLVVLL